MSEIQIVYCSIFDGETKELGLEVSSGITAAQLPDDPNGKNIFINKAFEGYSSSTWKVLAITTEQIVYESEDEEAESNVGIKCHITLEPIQYKSISVTEKHSSNGSKLVRGRLLECDFGFFSQDLLISNKTARNLDNFNGRLPYEMIKRRLVVVVSHKEDPALVVPISKTDKGKNKDTVVPITSLPNDLVGYKQKDCYAKAGAISFVSGHRLFPLRYEKNGRRVYDNRVEKKLSNEDVTTIKKAVFNGIGGSNILKEGDKAKVQLAELETETTQLKSELDKLKQEKDELWQLLEEQTS